MFARRVIDARSEVLVSTSFLLRARQASLSLSGLAVNLKLMVEEDGFGRDRLPPAAAASVTRSDQPVRSCACSYHQRKILEARLT
jgi:hypothetical protein